MTATGWIIGIAIVAAAIAAGFGIGHWIECRGREAVVESEVEEFDPHNFGDRPEEPR